MNYKINYDGYDSNIFKTKDHANKNFGVYKTLDEAQRALIKEIEKNIKYLQDRIESLIFEKEENIETE